MNATCAHFALAAALMLAVSTGCTKKNPSYCESEMDCPTGQHCDLTTHGCISDETDGGLQSCGGNAECPAAMPICEAGGCRVCKLDDECDSRVCREDGACEVEANVLYVAPSGPSAGMCTSAAPCDLMYARTLVSADRYWIRATNGTYSLPGAFVVSPPLSQVAIVGGRSAVFERSATGPSFDVRAGSKLILRGVTLHRGLVCDTGVVEITGAALNTPGAETRSWVQLSNCTAAIAASELDGSTALGIDSMSGGSLSLNSVSIAHSADTAVRFTNGQLSIVQSTIAQNMGMGVQSTNSQTSTVRRSLFYSNRMGGISVMGGGVFDVTNNFVYRNGNPANAPFGGMRLETTLPGNRVEHNTVVRNDAQYGASPVYGGGVYCKGGGTTANNLITNNFYGNEFDASAQVAGTCTFSGSLVLASDATAHFISAVAEPFDYHLADAQSAAANAGVVSNPVISDDFDGDARDAMPDVGADELH